jgi:hypothetical protein
MLSEISELTQRKFTKVGIIAIAHLNCQSPILGCPNSKFSPDDKATGEEKVSTAIRFYRNGKAARRVDGTRPSVA